MLPCFGFEPASKYGIISQWEGIPNEAFIVVVFDRNTMKGINSVAYYRDEFNEAV